MRSEPSVGREVSRTIDGFVASETVAPRTAQDVADALAEAAARELVVAPVGGGTALALGNPPERLDLVLSTLGLGGVIDYEPSDLVLSIGAGARLGDVQAILAEHGQTLPIDPPGGDEATIGGVIATARSGPRRLGSGTLRDLLIGISVAHPSGTVTKAGGMVVKNVTGFDLPRVYHGSLGTLGVIVSANFKLLPLPRADATAILRTTTAAEALAAADRIRTSRLQPVALEVSMREGSWTTAVRLVGREGTLPVAVDEARRLLGDAEQFEGADGTDWWNRYVAEQAAPAERDEAVFGCSVRPRRTAELVQGLLDVGDELGVEVLLLDASVGLGSVLARLRLGGEDGADDLVRLRDRLLGLADHVVVRDAPSVWKRGLDVWGPTPETIDVMRELKAQFDPGRVLNRGRFVGRI